MINTSTLSFALPFSAATELPATPSVINDVSVTSPSLTVPRDVAHKFEVESLSNRNETITALIERKIQESAASLENEAFYIVNLSTIVKKYSEWVTCLPRVKPYYAVKCNPNPAIVRTLAGLGANFDCASKSEIQQCLGSGIAASRIIFANPCKMRPHLEYAKSIGVEMMTFDNSHELIKISQFYPTAKLVLRIITDDSNSICRFSTKFGAPLDECHKLLTLAKQLNLNVVGISFHVGSGCMSSESFVAAIRSAHGVFQEAEALGFKFSMLDLGGGWPGTYSGRLSFADIANTIRPVIDELFPENIDVIAEPGRYFVAESHTLAVNVYAKRSVNGDDEDNKRFLYYVNDGVYQSFNCIFFDHYNPTPLVFENKVDKKKYPCTIFGPTCDSLDCIGKDILLPEMEIGEWLYFQNMGAYTTAAASPFNGYKANPLTFYVM
jgi:ornithine decarboxylase